MLKIFLPLYLLFSIPAFADVLDEQKPKDMESKMWLSFKSTYNEVILNPTPVGLGEAGGFYGASVAIDGNRALIGAPSTLNSGAVFVLEFDGINWNRTAILKPLTFYSNGFGSSVSLSGNLALVGNPNDGDNGMFSGAAHIYEWDGIEWVETKLIASDGSENQAFGYSVSIDNNRAIIGALYGHEADDYTGSAYIYESNGINWLETKISPSDGNFFDQFGSSVSIDGDRVLIGAKENQNQNIYTGSAYVYDWDGNDWIETKLTASDGVDFDSFGFSVSLEDDTVIVGAAGDDDNGDDSGAIYIYQWNGVTWQESKLIASDGAAGDVFGEAAIKNGRIVVGAPGDDDNGNNSGSTYIYDWNGNNWLETKLTASEGAQSDQFGSSTALFGDFVFVGVPRDDGELVNSGSAYLYQWNGLNWDENKSSLAPGSAGDQFGHSVSYSDNRVLVGAPYDYENGMVTGSAYIFEWNDPQWVTTKIIPSSVDQYSDFGYAVSIDGDRAVIGAQYDSGNSSDSGAVFVYDWDGNNWVETKIYASDGASENAFGRSLQLEGSRIIVGSPFDDDNGNNSGSVYIFDWDGNNWIESKLTASDGANSDQFGLSVSISGNQVLVGAPGSATIGATYLFDWDGLKWNELKIEPGDITGSGSFGDSVSLSDDRFVVGAPEGFDNGNYSGSAYIYDRDGANWVETKLNSTNISAYNEFGRSVSIDEDKVVIGNPVDSNDGNNFFGSAFVYDWNGSSWSETKLIPNNSTNYDGFGSAVYNTENIILVGAKYGQNNLSSTGLLFIYQAPDVIFKNGFENP
jgi:hypothetical protein